MSNFAQLLRLYAVVPPKIYFSKPTSNDGALRKHEAITSFTWPGMELKDLSSNWRKLQETLKNNSKPASSPAAKRKRTDHETSSTALKKRPKTSTYAEKRIDKKAASQKRKRGAMSTEEVTDEKQKQVTLKGAPETNGSVASTVDEKGWNGKVNEGLSPT